jgi:hypothetical protein
MVADVRGWRQMNVELGEVGSIKPARRGNYDRATFGIYKDMPLDSMNNEQATFNTVSEDEIFGDRDFPSWLTQQQIRLAGTTYQTSRLMLIGAAPETNRISAFWRIFDRAIGLFCTP